MKNILIIGQPGIGKTILVKKLGDIFKEFNPAGFYKSEITEQGIKTGYALTQLGGDSIILAHVNVKSRVSVGKLHVDIKGFESFMDVVFSKEKKTGLYIIDEISKIECESKKFCRLITEFLNSDRPVLAVTAEKGTGLVSEIKKRSDVRIIELTDENRELKQKVLTMELRDLLLE